MGNLLSNEHSFYWQDSHIDRGHDIQVLNEALVDAISYKDRIFKTPNLDLLTLPWGNFIEFFYSYGYEEAERKNVFPWMGQIQFQTLLNILYSLARTTPNNSSNLQELNNEFPKQNNALFGFPVTPLLVPYVKCKPSLSEFHRNYVSRFTFQQQKDNFQYFKKFYKPVLKISLQAFQNRIRKGNEHSSIIRIDPIKNIIHDKIHVHLSGTEDVALNIDGTWRHAPVNKFTINERVKETLSGIGFLLPDECYI